MKNLFILIVLALFISGCASHDNQMTPYLSASVTTSPEYIITPSTTLTTTLTATPSNTPKPTVTLTLTPDFQALKNNGIIDTRVVASLGKKISPPWYKQRIEFSPDGKLLASSYSNIITLWKVGKFEKLYELKFLNQNYGVENFVFSSSSKYLAATVSYWDDDQTHLYIWETSDGKQILEFDLERAILLKDSESEYNIKVSALAFVPETSILAFANGNTVQLEDIDKPNEPVILKLGQRMFASEISFPQDGRFIYVLMSWWKDHDFPANWKTKYAVQIWDANSHILRKTLDYPEIEWADEFMALHNSFVTRRIPAKGTLELTSLENEKILQLPYRQGTAFFQGWEYITNDNKFVIFMHYFGIDDEQGKGIEFWTTDSWKHLYTLKPECYKAFSSTFGGIQLGSDPGEIAISPNNQLFAIAYAGQVIIYDIRLITSSVP
jgi:WD40 repeat protein